MKTTVYKDEQGVIESLHLHAENDDERKQLAGAAKHFAEDTPEPEAKPLPEVTEEPEPEKGEEPVPQQETEPEPEPEAQAEPSSEEIHTDENATVQ